MTDGSSLINFGELSKPATVLIEKICNAVGIIYEPTRIKRLARAEIEADRIKALAQVELLDVERRALGRLLQQETRRQENIESIAAQAASALAPDAKVDLLDEDWVAHFFKQCDTVSNKEMQSLWARLLAGEATAPGSFSKRTVNLVSNLDRRDAELFSSFCQFVWVIGEPVPLIYDFEDKVYTDQGIRFESLKHLDALGLISFESFGGYARKGFDRYALASYHGVLTAVEISPDTGGQIDVGHAVLTSVGRELFGVCGPVRNDKFYEYIIQRWFEKGLTTSSIRLSPHATSAYPCQEPG